MDTHTETPTPLVSVMIATYNRASYMRIAVESVLAQTYQNWELVIIDDGSTDDTQRVAGSFMDARIRYVRLKQNSGIHAARTRALKECRGEYLAVLDSDDMWTSPG
ncbi:MAG: glycosyltransferase family 2 protein, partial [bacterium]|nr:glycosyltransferase family 2 protein [bacterium]